MTIVKVGSKKELCFSCILISVILFGMVGCVSGETYYINSTVLNAENPVFIIEEPGIYLFDEDISGIPTSQDEYRGAIWIKTSDVVLDGQYHSLSSDLTDILWTNSALIISSSEDFGDTPDQGSDLENVTIRNIYFDMWQNSVFAYNTNSLILTGNVFSNTQSAIYCGNSQELKIEDNTLNPGCNPYDYISITATRPSSGVLIANNSIYGGGPTSSINIDSEYVQDVIIHSNILQGGSESDHPGIFSLADKVIIENNLLQCERSCVFISGDEYLIRNNTFESNEQFIQFNGRNSIIEDNQFGSSPSYGCGVNIGDEYNYAENVSFSKNKVDSEFGGNLYGNRCKIIDCEFSGWDGIAITGNENIINNSIFYSTGHTMVIWLTGDNCEIINNSLYGGSPGQGGSIIQIYGSNNILSGNTIQGEDYGITMIDGMANFICNNTISGSLNGISISDSDMNQIYGNFITENEEAGILITVINTDCQNLIFNNYLKNLNNIVFSANSPSCSWNIESGMGPNIIGGPRIGGNYWGAPDGTGVSDLALDEDNDGFADEPYEIDAQNIDYYPLVHFTSPPEYGIYYLNSTVLNNETTRYIIDQPGTYLFDEDIIDLEFPCDTSGTFSEGYPLIWVRSSDVVIEGNGYALDAIDQSNGIPVSAIFIGDSGDEIESLRLENVTVRNLSLSNWYIGIESHSVANHIIEKNFIKNCGFGILINGELPLFCDIRVRMNTITSDGFEDNSGYCGIQINMGDFDENIVAIVENNQVSLLEGCAIRVDGGTAQINSNIVTNCGEGISSGSAGIISNNIVTGSNDWAISGFGYEMEIINNTVSQNPGGGFYLGPAEYSVIRDNIIEGNGLFGIIFDGADCHIFNNYLNNTQNLDLEALGEWCPQHSWNASVPIEEQNIAGGPSIGGNYWGTPEGSGYSQTAVDQNHDGFADEPYVIISGYWDMDYDGTPEYHETIDYFPLVTFDQIPDNQPPYAFLSFDFPDSSNKDIPTPDDVITFFDNSWDPDDGDTITEWSWDFGDGETSDEQNPLHQYCQSGFYTVNLKVTDGNGAMGSCEEEILVNYPPVVDFTMDIEPPLIAGQIVHFTGTATDQDGTIIELTWQVFSGSQPYPEIVSTDINMGYEFTTPDLYVITLTAIDNLGSPGIAGYILVVNELEETLYFLMAPGVEFDGINVTFDSASVDEFIGNVFSIDDDTLTITMNGLTTTLVTDGFTEVNGLLQGEVNSITVENAPLVWEIADIGDVGASFKANLTPENSAYLEDVIIAVSINETASTGVQTAYELAAVDASLDIVDIAYAFNIIGATLENGVDVMDATIVMTAPESWVVSQGGPDRVRIFRYSEYDGTTEILEPIYVFDEIAGVYTFTALSPNGLSVFSLVAVIETIPDTTPPLISDLLATPNPASINTPVLVTVTVDDSLTGGSTITNVEYSVDGITWNPLIATDGAFDEMTESATVTLPGRASAEVFNVLVRTIDAAGNNALSDPLLVAVYDPNGAFVTAGGWILSPVGAYMPDATSTGKANLGLNCKYKKGTTIPTGETEFHLKDADLKFKATSYEWLVITGPKAIYRGSGTINGNGLYGFQIVAVDGALSGGDDTFRIQIWEKATNTLVYDNGAGSTTGDPGTTLGGGNVKIHK